MDDRLAFAIVAGGFIWLVYLTVFPSIGLVIRQALIKALIGKQVYKPARRKTARRRSKRG